MNKQKVNQIRALRRQQRARAHVKSSGRLRLSVQKTLKHIRVQIIDDMQGRTLVAASDLEIKDKKLNKTALAVEVGKLIATKAKAKNIADVVFDKGRFKYHGRIQAVAEGAREGGLNF